MVPTRPRGIRQPQAGAAADAEDGHRGLRAEAEDRRNPRPGTRSSHYLLRNLVIDRPNQVWAADITYIPIGRGFLYLVAVIDWASRAVLTWRLSNTMDTSFCIAALEEALAHFGKPEIFNTDESLPQRRPGAASSPAPSSPAHSRWPRFRSRWMGAADGWTTSSSSGCGAA